MDFVVGVLKVGLPKNRFLFDMYPGVSTPYMWSASSYVCDLHFVVQEPEQTEALPLVVSTPKRKRTKVTDTRLSPRAARALLQDGLHHPAVDSYSASNSVSSRPCAVLSVQGP